LGCVLQGLGVVCNKEGGFGEEDFVVEFLGEVWLPTVHGIQFLDLVEFIGRFI